MASLGSGCAAKKSALLAAASLAFKAFWATRTASAQWPKHPCFSNGRNELGMFCLANIRKKNAKSWVDVLMRWYAWELGSIKMLEMEVYMLVFTCPAGVTVKPDWIMFAIFCMVHWFWPHLHCNRCSQWDVFVHRVWNLCWSIDFDEETSPTHAVNAGSRVIFMFQYTFFNFNPCFKNMSQPTITTNFCLDRSGQRATKLVWTVWMCFFSVRPDSMFPAASNFGQTRGWMSPMAMFFDYKRLPTWQEQNNYIEATSHLGVQNFIQHNTHNLNH